ncbi:hypothetical protein [Nonomuraea jabiensis]|uniref:MFS transporter n=1 Tax=Nonomuraea jabiensis TaxID=882448 RepID=A0A7W9LF78_9ACTN|nr:hypothetical protein [Nonomuraea jabiensis]MBB5781574.1 hypothetical protein [Nonomuraea jabiensis]
MRGALGSLPSGVADAARESIDRAVAVVGRLPAEQGGDLLDAARDAFTSGVHVVGFVSAAFYAGLAVLALRAFRHVPNAHGGDDDTTDKDQQTGPVLEAAPAT